MNTAHGLRLDIQGLRALAVLAVILFHVHADWLPGGFVGVDVFFAISGFIVSRVILQKGDRFSWIGFYSGRLRRIVPAYLVMLAGVALLAGVLLTPSDFALFEKSLRRALVFVSNQYFAQAGDYFAPAVHEWPLLHTWSLAIEMQFYVLLPLLLRTVPQSALPTCIGLLCAASFGWTHWQLAETDTQVTYYALVARAPEFLMGAWLAAVLVNKAVPAACRQPVAWLGMGMMLSAFVLLNGKEFSPLWAVWPCTGALLVIAADGPTTVGRWLSARWAVIVGALSYSLYLWHWPVLALARYTWQQNYLPWLATGACVIVFSSLAWLSWRFVEQPLLRPKATWRMGGITASAFMMAIMGSLALAHQVNAALVALPPPAAALRYAPAESICHGQEVGTCERGAGHVPATVLLMGDSHAAQLNLFMDSFGQAHGFRATVLSASSCVPVPGYSDARLAQWAMEPCRHMQRVVESQQSAMTVLVAGKWSYQLDNPTFLPAFKQFLKQTQSKGQRVVILGQLPMLTHDPIRTIRLNALGISLVSARDPKVGAANALLKEVAEMYPGVKFVDFSSSPLFETTPFYKGDMIYMDKHHLNELGAVRYAEQVGTELAELLTTGVTRP